MRKLKPCPRCGINAGALDCLFMQITSTSMEKRWFCKCNQCGAVTSDFKEIEDAKKHWNAGGVVAEPD